MLGIFINGVWTTMAFDDEEQCRDALYEVFGNVPFTSELATELKWEFSDTVTIEIRKIE